MMKIISSNIHNPGFVNSVWFIKKVMQKGGEHDRDLTFFSKKIKL